MPRRRLLVRQEAGVPDREAGGDRWSLDHLFIDQESVPSLVEVKRSDDTRIRREVVGQMLDYAANGVVYLPVERLRADFEAHCAKEGKDADEVFPASLGDALEPEPFWDEVGQNLPSGRVRLETTRSPPGRQMIFSETSSTGGSAPSPPSPTFIRVYVCSS